MAFPAGLVPRALAVLGQHGVTPDVTHEVPAVRWEPWDWRTLPDGTVLVTGMVVGTIFTLFVVPVFYSLIAAQHKPVVMTGEYPVQTPQLAQAPAT